MELEKFNHFKMRAKINFLFFLLVSLSVIIGKVKSVNRIDEYIRFYSMGEGRNIIDSDEHILKVLKNGKIYVTNDVIVWKGTYDDDIPVAIKIFPFFNQDLFNQELSIFEALNAINNRDAESYGIPQVYYCGTIFGKYKAIAMSLFEKTVLQQLTIMKKPFSEFSILRIFKLAVNALKYLNINRVLHNDIKPGNLFLRGKDVFVADFDLSTTNEIEGEGWTPEYGSSNMFANVNRCAMDDLESLVYSMWSVAGFKFREPYGSLLLKEKEKNTAESWVKEICKRFKLKITQDVFTDICINEMLSDEKVPKYDRILQLLSNAIDEVTQKTKQTEFEWLSKTLLNRYPECVVL